MAWAAGQLHQYGPDCPGAPPPPLKEMEGPHLHLCGTGRDQGQGQGRDTGCAQWRREARQGALRGSWARGGRGRAERAEGVGREMGERWERDGRGVGERWEGDGRGAGERGGREEGETGERWGRDGGETGERRGRDGREREGGRMEGRMGGGRGGGRGSGQRTPGSKRCRAGATESTPTVFARLGFARGWPPWRGW